MHVKGFKTGPDRQGLQTNIVSQRFKTVIQSFKQTCLEAYYVPISVYIVDDGAGTVLREPQLEGAVS